MRNEIEPNAITVWADGGNTGVTDPSSGKTYTCGGVHASGDSGTQQGKVGEWSCARINEVVHKYDCRGTFARPGGVCRVWWKDVFVDGNPWEAEDDVYRIECNPRVR